MSERMHDRWLSESRGKVAYTEWLEAEYEKLRTKQEELRMVLHRSWLTLNQPKKDYGNE